MEVENHLVDGKIHPDGIFQLQVELAVRVRDLHIAIAEAPIKGASQTKSSSACSPSRSADFLGLPSS
jgi:hypothetical protein